MTTPEGFDIKKILIKKKDILDISDILFLEVIPLVTDAMFACYPALGIPSVAEFKTELSSRINGWYVWTKHTQYKGELRQIAVNLICRKYQILIASLQYTQSIKNG